MRVRRPPNDRVLAFHDDNFFRNFSTSGSHDETLPILLPTRRPRYIHGSLEAWHPSSSATPSTSYLLTPTPKSLLFKKLTLSPEAK